MNENVEYLKVEEVDSFNDVKSFDKPYVVRGGCSDMPAVKKWNLDYLSKIETENKISANRYKTKTDMQNTFSYKNVLVNFKDFIENIKIKKYFYLSDIPFEELSLKTKDLYEDVSNDSLDIDDNYEESRLFIGNSCGLGMHIHIMKDVILNQIFGDKSVYFYNYNKKYFGGNMSDIGKVNLSCENFFIGDHTDKELYKVVLKPGDSLYIPPWWWHATESNGISCSVAKVYSRKNILYLFRYPKLLFFLLKL